MAKGLSKFLNTKKSKLFWVYFVLGVLITAISVLLMPFWQKVAPNAFFSSWGLKFIKILIAVIVLLYAILFLGIRVTRGGNSVVKTLGVIEIVVLVLISIALLVSQFSKFALDAYVIISVALWMRGVVEIFKAYYAGNGENKYPVIKLVFAIVLVSVGAYFLSVRFITNLHILWVATVFGAVFGIITFILGFLKRPIEKAPAQA
ncbi:MAG: hypothetical protein IJA97_02945 [Clostridia bacterium]|nr:hypothetical protein [Clostridia bacterium]